MVCDTRLQTLSVLLLFIKFPRNFIANAFSIRQLVWLKDNQIKKGFYKFITTILGAGCVQISGTKTMLMWRAEWWTSVEWLTHFISRTKRQKPLHGSTICNVQEGNVLSSHVIVMVLGLMTVKQKLQLYANQKVTILKSNTNIKHVSKAPFLYGKRLKLSYRYLSTPQYTWCPQTDHQISNAARSIRSTTQSWVVTRHQYGISALVSQTSFGGETSGKFAKCRLFSQANVVPADRNVQLGSSIQDQMLRLPCYL